MYLGCMMKKESKKQKNRDASEAPHAKRRKL
jgi:hypothetical protein